MSQTFNVLSYEPLTTFSSSTWIKKCTETCKMTVENDNLATQCSSCVLRVLWKLPPNLSTGKKKAKYSKQLAWNKLLNKAWTKCKIDARYEEKVKTWSQWTTLSYFLSLKKTGNTFCKEVPVKVKNPIPLTRRPTRRSTVGDALTTI